ncbi:hypothetical protein D9757_002497 [Collybiopsis confluens]|uniref:amidase n=1 Tax=Collybiopsis confluens TaxID=2823264 RepID=A0A8H5HY62_9AGAR|nr:hypothetical protein D9757_002497 [Collybiopsis confluens]
MYRSKPQTLTPLAAALAGALGACFSTAAKTRIQALPKVKGKDDLSMFALIARIFKKEGPLALYSGFGATMLNTFSMQYAYFFFYSIVRTSYISRITRKLPKGSKVPALSTAAELLLGAIAGAFAQIFTIPVSVIATRQQVGRISESSTPLPSNTTDVGSGVSSDESFMAVAREIVEEEGVGGLWLGIKPSLILTVNPAITYGMYERVKSLLLLAKAKTGANTQVSAGQSFVVGALSKTLATVARSADLDNEDLEDPPEKVVPHKKHHDKSRHPGALDILARTLKREGIIGWYQGMQAQIIKAVLSQALLFMSKEQFERWTLALIVLWFTSANNLQMWWNWGKSEAQAAVEQKRAERERLLNSVPSGLNHEQYLKAAAHEIVAHIQKGEWTAKEVVEAYISQAVVAQRATNCVTEVLFDQALKRAGELDAHFASTKKLVGPLHGVPFSAKDQFDVANFDSSIGFSAWTNKPADSNAVLIDQLISLGAIGPIVKTNVPQTMFSFECRNPLWGLTTNPYNPDYTCGGSSGGEAALLAMHGAAFGIGSDIGGSLRVPTAYCGSNAGFEGIKAVAGPMTRLLMNAGYFAGT